MALIFSNSFNQALQTKFAAFSAALLEVGAQPTQLLINVIGQFPSLVTAFFKQNLS